MKNDYIILYVTLLITMAAAIFRYSGADIRRHLFGDELITLEHYTWAGVKTSGEQLRIPPCERLRDIAPTGRSPDGHGALLQSGPLDRAQQPLREQSSNQWNDGVKPPRLCRISPAPRLVRGGYFRPATGESELRGFFSALMVLDSLGFHGPLAPVFGLLQSGGARLQPHGFAANGLDSHPGCTHAETDIHLARYTLRSAGDSQFPQCRQSRAGLGSARVPRSLRVPAAPMGRGHGGRDPLAEVGQVAVPQEPAGARDWHRILRFFPLVDRLPYIFSSMQQYGVPAGTMAQWRAGLSGIANVLFPGLGWKIFAALGLLGLLLPGKDRWRQWITVLTIMTCVISLAHFVLARKLPYGRVAGYILPLIFLGIANDIRILLSHIPTPRSRVVAWVTLSAWLATLTWPSFGMKLTEPDFKQLLAQVKKQKCPVGISCYPLFAINLDPLDIMKYLPDDWLDFYDRVPVGKQVTLLAFLAGAGDRGMEVRDGRGPSRTWDLESWPSSCRIIQSGIYRVVSLRGTTEPFRSQNLTEDRGVIFWYPNARSVAVTPEPVLGLVKSAGVRYLVQNIRHQVKLDVFGRVNCVVLIFETPTDWDLSRKCVSEGIRRFGGDAIVFQPVVNVALEC